MQRLPYLLHRYFENTATPEEVDEVMPFIEDPANEEVIKTAMDQFWNGHTAINPVFSAETSEAMLNRVLAADEPRLPYTVKKKKTWLYAAAAAVILMLGFAAYYQSATSRSKIENADKPGALNKGAAPGHFKAVLTLADNSTLILDSTANGLLREQGNAKVIKKGQGRLEYVISGRQAGNHLFNTITTPRGGEYQVTLSDGSRAWLNAASSIRFPVDFGDSERKVGITGEVYFEVVKNASRPFVVSVAGKGEIKVLGTQFNINSYSDEASVKTTLMEGSVMVTSLNAKTSTVISPGEQAELTANGQLKVNRDVNEEVVTAWKNGVFSFSNAELWTVLRQLSRWYDVDFVVEGPVPQKRFEGEMGRDLKLSQVLRLLENNGVHFKIEGNKITVSR